MGFDSFLGNAKAVRLVREMLVRGRVPGSLLFTGPDGIGKKTLAVMLAKTLNCERREPDGNDFCDQCSSCRKADEFVASSTQDLAQRRDTKDAQKRVEGLVYFDLQLIEPLTRYILIEQIRQLRATAYSRPFSLRQRVLIVDQAQAIHWQAADLMLKVLEEPPETSTLILISPNAYDLRPTIRSRCFSVPFVPIEEAVIERTLIEERGFSKGGLTLALRVANGSIAQARTFDPKAYLEQRRPWLTLLDSLAGHSPRPPAPQQWKTLFEATKVLADDRSRFEESLKMGSTLLRDLMLVLLGEQNSAVTNSDLLPHLKMWGQALGLARIQKLQDGIENSYRLQNRNVNQQLASDSLAAEILRSEPRV